MKALDTATEDVAKRLPQKPKVTKSAPKAKAVRRVHRRPQSKADDKGLPDAKLSVLSKHGRDLAGITDAAEKVLAEGDARAEAKIKARHLREL